MRRIIFIILYLSSFYVMAQSSSGGEEPRNTVFFFAPMADVSFYGRHSISAGGGFILGSDDRVSIGISGLYFIAPGAEDEDRIDMLEITVFLRYYIFEKTPTGLFAQVNAGAAIYAFVKEMDIPVDTGSLSLGISAGWRFPFKEFFYVEPVVRFGYPFIIGVGVAVGFRI